MRYNWYVFLVRKDGEYAQVQAAEFLVRLTLARAAVYNVRAFEATTNFSVYRIHKNR